MKKLYNYTEFISEAREEDIKKDWYYDVYDKESDTWYKKCRLNEKIYKKGDVCIFEYLEFPDEKTENVILKEDVLDEVRNEDGSSIKKLEELVVGRYYEVLELGMNEWYGDNEYKGFFKDYNLPWDITYEFLTQDNKSIKIIGGFMFNSLVKDSLKDVVKNITKYGT